MATWAKVCTHLDWWNLVFWNRFWPWYMPSYNAIMCHSIVMSPDFTSPIDIGESSQYHCLRTRCSAQKGSYWLWLLCPPPKHWILIWNFTLSGSLVVFYRLYCWWSPLSALCRFSSHYLFGFGTARDRRFLPFVRCHVAIIFYRNNGVCECGICQCNTHYSGTFCECSTVGCPKDEDRKSCGGL